MTDITRHTWKTCDVCKALTHIQETVREEMTNGDCERLAWFENREPLVQELMRKVIDDVEYEFLEDQFSVEQKVADVRDFKVTE